MFNEINNFLDLTIECPVPFDSIIISDFTRDDGAFLVHHFISYFLKKRPLRLPPQVENERERQQQPLSTTTTTSAENPKHVYLVSFAQTLNHFHCVAQKFGLNLRQLQDSGSFRFFDGLKWLGKTIIQEDDEEEDNRENPLSSALHDGSLKEFFIYLTSQLETDKKDDTCPPNLIIDNFGILLSLGVPLAQLIAFYQALKSYICIERHGSLVVHLNIAEEDEDEQLLLKHLSHMTECHLQVWGLATGYCKDIHGEITATWYELSPLPKPKIKRTQFKLLDKNVSLFAAGMSQAVL